MPAITEGLYRVDVFQLVGGQTEVLNTFWYRETSGDNDDETGVFNAFDSTIMQTWANAVDDGVQFIRTEVTSVFGSDAPLSFTPGVTVGEAPGTAPLAPFVCFSIRKLRTTKETKSGFWRFSGCNEEGTSGRVFESVRLALYQDLAELLDDLIGGAGTLDPVIVRPPGTYASGVQTGWIYNPITLAQAVDRVTTQNSRKTF